MANQPYLPLYTGDWKKDPALSICSPATRGIWIDILCSLHDARISQLTGTPDQLARVCRCDSGSMQSALDELQRTGTANVSNRDGVFTVVCRRMKKAQDLSKVRAEAGRKGGSKKLPSPESESENCSQELIEKFCVSIGLPKSDGEYLWNKWQGNGWTNGGKPIKNWQSTIRSWRIGRFLPSQKQGVAGSNVNKPERPPVDVPAEFITWFTTDYEGQVMPDTRWTDWNRIPWVIRDSFIKWRQAKSA